MSRARSRCGDLAILAIAGLLEGCASHSERMIPVRTALDAGDPRGAIALLDQEMEVQARRATCPRTWRATTRSSSSTAAASSRASAAFDHSKRDLEAADKAIDMLDLAHDAKDTIGEYVFSGSSGKYQAPPYEKLLVNTLDMLNYLELRDLDGARVEARRLAVMQKYISDDLHEGDNPVLGLGGMLAGLTFEESEQADEALRWYDQALQFTGFRSLRRSGAAAAAARGRTARRGCKELEAAGPAAGPIPPRRGEGEIVFVVGYGRVPHKIAAAHPHRPRAHDGTPDAHLARQRGEGERARGAGPRHVDELPDARARAGRLRRAGVRARRALRAARGGGGRDDAGARRVEEDRGQDRRQRDHAHDHAPRGRCRGQGGRGQRTAWWASSCRSGRRRR